MLGRVKDRVVIEDGVPVTRQFIPLRITFDERVDDGLTAQAGAETFGRIMRDPDRYLGSLDPDAPPFAFAAPLKSVDAASPAEGEVSVEAVSDGSFVA